MLPAPYRLRGKRNLRRAQTSSHVLRTRNLALRIVRRGDTSVPRIAIAVGRRVSSRAVERNRITRWLREAFRASLSRMRPGVDLRLSATGPSAAYSYEQCVQEVEQLLRKANLLPRE